jgi:archaetidylinositol phosphate synthase
MIMTFYTNRERFEKLSVKLGAAFSKLGLSPNQWTMLSILPALAALYFLVNSQFLQAAAFFILSAFLDMVDGAVARVMGKATRLGAYLDTMVDRIIEFLIVLGLVFIGLPDFYLPAAVWIFIYYFGAVMTSYSKAAAKEKDLIEKEISGGLAERAERLIILFIGILLAALDPVYLTYVIVILAFLSNFTAMQRAYIAKRSSDRERKTPI